MATGADVLSQVIGQHHVEKMQKSLMDARAHEALLNAYLEGKVDQPTGQYAAQKLETHLPAEAKPLVQRVWHKIFPDRNAQPQLNVPQLPPPPPVHAFTPEEQAQRTIAGQRPLVEEAMKTSVAQRENVMNFLKSIGVDPSKLTQEQLAALGGVQLPATPFHGMAPGTWALFGNKVIPGPPAFHVQPEGAQGVMVQGMPPGYTAPGIPAPPGTTLAPQLGSMKIGDIPPPPAASAQPAAAGSIPGVTMIPGAPPRLTDKESIAKKAVTDTLARHGLAIPPDFNPRDPWAALPSNLVKEAQFQADPMLQDRAENLQELRAMRGLRSQIFSQRIKEYNVSHDPEFIQSVVDQMKTSPEVYWDSAFNEKGVRPLIAKAWVEQTGKPVPIKLEGTMKTNRDNSLIGLNHIKIIDSLIDDPAIAKRRGAVYGRIGNAEQTLGATVGLTPEDSYKIQRFRTAMNILFMREGRILFGGRPPEKLMRQLETTSPNMRMTEPMLRAAIDQARAIGKANVQTSDEAMYGRERDLSNVPAIKKGSAKNAPAAPANIIRTPDGKKWQQQGNMMVEVQ